MAEAKSRWIKVSDRLPEHYGDILVAYKGINILENKENVIAITIGHYRKGEKKWYFSTDHVMTTATHWMPLPPSPKDK